MRNGSSRLELISQQSGQLYVGGCQKPALAAGANLRFQVGDRGIQVPDLAGQSEASAQERAGRAGNDQQGKWRILALSTLSNCPQHLLEILWGLAAFGRLADRG